jgi:undecaprenyl-diphosphatase
MHRHAIAFTTFFGGAFFATIFLFKTDPDEFVALDTMATRVVAPFQSFTPSEFFIALTTLGSATGIILVTLLIAFFLRSQKMLVLRLVTALLASGLSVMIGKLLIARVRPDGLPWLIQLHTYSFPSGHTASATVLYGFCITLFYYRVRNATLRHLLILGSLFLILGVGMSRIVLAVHYGSDVLGGLFLGGCSLSLVFVYPLTRSERLYLKKST